MTTIEDFAQLADRVRHEIDEAVRMPRLEAVRSALNEVGIRDARTALKAAPLRIAEKAEALRNSLDAERQVKERLAAELLAADWDLDARFIHEGNRWFLLDETAPEGRRQMTADERAKWKAAEAAKADGVVAVAAALRAAEHRTAEARDALSVAERHFSACKYDLTAAVAELGALGIGIGSTPDREDTR